MHYNSKNLVATLNNNNEEKKSTNWHQCFICDSLLFYIFSILFVVNVFLGCCTVVAADPGICGESHGGGTEVRLLLEAGGDVHVVRITNRRDGSRCDTNL